MPTLNNGMTYMNRLLDEIKNCSAWAANDKIKTKLQKVRLSLMNMYDNAIKGKYVYDQKADIAFCDRQMFYHCETVDFDKVLQDKMKS